MERFEFLSKNKVGQLPKTAGIYVFSDGRELLYIGKAANMRERVKNHFQQPAYRDNLFINQVSKVGFIKTESEIEALILEANLIKKYQPKYNIVWRDDKNYFFVAVTKEDFPRVFLTHQTKLKTKTYNLKPIYIGPFVDGKALKETLKILRKVFPYRSCKTLPKKPCLWYQLGRCPAPCLLKTNLGHQLVRDPISNIEKECKENAKNLMKILQGKKIQVLKDLKKEMKKASVLEEFEKAARIRDQILALEKILAHAKIFEETTDLIRLWQDKVGSWKKIEKKLKEVLKVKNKISRIEAYDVSNIQGKEATGAMITFINGLPDKNFYRRFKIRISGKPNDIAMLKECLNRRFKHQEWPYPDLILIDGGRGQLNAGHQCLKWQIKQPRVMALAKKKNELYLENRKQPIRLNSLPDSLKFLILQLRDEAHRFAISYHKKLRKKALLDE